MVHIPKSVIKSAIQLRRSLHQIPETGLHLPKTQALLLDAIKKYDINPKLGQSLSSVTVDIDGQSAGKTLLLRADMDALPIKEAVDIDFKSKHEGNMHACGHDMHTAILYGTLAYLMQEKPDLAGRVRLMFQPGEEGFHGAKHMINEGVLEGVDAAFGLHVNPKQTLNTLISRPGPLMSGAESFEINLTGKGGHAAMPHETYNLAQATMQTAQAIQSLPSQLFVHEPKIIYVTGLHMGTASNIVANNSTIIGGYRYFDKGMARLIAQEIEHIVHHLPKAYHCEGIIKDNEGGYPPTITDQQFFQWLRESVLLDLETEPYPHMGSEDFSYVLEQVPGCFVFLGACPNDIEPEQSPPLHSDDVIINEACIEKGIETMVRVLLAYLNQSSVHP